MNIRHLAAITATVTALFGGSALASAATMPSDAHYKQVAEEHPVHHPVVHHPVVHRVVHRPVVHHPVVVHRPAVVHHPVVEHHPEPHN